MKRVAIGLALLALAFVAVTGVALESSGVAVVATEAPDGSTRETHVWWVEDEGALWLEAGTPENPWFEDVRARPELHLVAEGATGRYRAVPVPGPEARSRLRSRLRARYGWRDVWVGWLFDVSRSVAVRLEPLADG